MSTATDKPLVSVVVPAYNAAPYIRECLDSVVSQTWPNWEAFVVDDGSTDDTVAIARTYESDRLKVIVQKNSGACVARNKGLSLSRGKYIQFLDADDLISADKLEKQVLVLEQNPGYLAVSANVHFMHGEDYRKMAPREESRWIFDTDDPVDFLVRLYGGYGERWMVQTSSWLTPRSITDAIGPWNEQLLLDQDGEYFARAVLASKGIRVTGGVNYYRRFVAGGNISAKYNKRENLLSAMMALDLKASYLRKHTQSEASLRALATLYLEIAINAYPNNPDIVARCEEVIRQYPGRVSLPVMGGRLVEIVKNTLGWKAAKRFRMTVHKLLNRSS
ncbi:MAG: glycosyltransferase family 2 protein [Bacteroidetes bacterium]|nr:glycosyltransferase family 2 protein [Bacteroidota bacterium]